MTQIWKDIKNYEGFYQVSNFGRVKSLNYRRTGKEKILKPDKKKGGYYQVNLSKKGCKPYHPRVHKLVFETFYRRCLPNEEVHHISGDKLDNKTINLVAKDKFLHKSEHKRGKKGIKHTEQSKQKMSEARKGKKLSPESIAKRTATRKLKKLLDPNYGKRK